MNRTPSSPHRRPSRALAAALLALVALGAAGCSDGEEPETGTASGASQSETPSPTPSPSDQDTATPMDDDARENQALLAATTVSLAEAVKAAGDDEPDGRPVAVELGRTAREAPHWTVTLAGEDGSAVVRQVDAASGAVSDSPRGDEPDDEREDREERQALLKEAETDAAGAAKAATDRRPGTAVKAELEESDGSAMWQVEVVDQETFRTTEVDVDAADGRVLRENTAD
ncbi:PepSY domain-containing protein [Streptomyces sp. NPDC058373]|uniref:PepSY domain-containing protein n=1 Tax=Streptomyces sp. NPDC058373 TaxID=3346465 RepID=UPI00365941D0